ncbi:KH domain-containing protein [Mediannikoviicoccus vaginalis]|uniref:KH domain-containing protein n=1 Tax=Mediannikoviicoccus vaginalis TaxID=2899727 RepID=UPI001F275516|nr:KH domain-containing protein [Mediannikoviicoccus vaginalis]
MLELVELIAKELVTKPEEVVVTSRQEGNTFVIEIRADKDDLGRIIGKEGRIAKAIRTVVKASAIKDGTKVAVDILQ